jgi:hypothetical protein
VSEFTTVVECGDEGRTATTELRILNTPRFYKYSQRKVKLSLLSGRGRTPMGHETSRLTHSLDKRLTDGGEVSITRRPRITPPPPQEVSWYSLLSGAESTPGPRRGLKDYVS